MSAQPADLVPAVEAYLAANGLNDTLSALKSEAKKKNLTPTTATGGVRGYPGRPRRRTRASTMNVNARCGGAFAS
jgi:hypothetical protein